MELSYQRFGEGTPLIILHGLYGSSDNWLTFGRKIAKKGFEVFLVDLRNHGDSAFDNSHTYEDMKKDLFTFCYHHDITSPMVLGHSMGGKAAMFFAAGYPDVVKKLVVIDISPSAYETKSSASQTANHAEIIKAMRSIDISNIKTRTDAQKQLLKTIPSKPVVQFLLKNLTRDDNKNFIWKLNLEALENHLPEIMEGLTENDVANKELLKELPALFVKGEKSNYITAKDKDTIRGLFTNAEITTIKGAGHWVHAEKPDEVFETVLKFLQQG